MLQPTIAHSAMNGGSHCTGIPIFTNVVSGITDLKQILRDIFVRYKSTSMYLHYTMIATLSSDKIRRFKEHAKCHLYISDMVRVQSDSDSFSPTPFCFARGDQLRSVKGKIIARLWRHSFWLIRRDLLRFI